MKRKNKHNLYSFNSILDSWDGAQKAQQPDPYFFNRIQQKISAGQNESFWDQMAFYLTRPRLAFLLAFLFVFGNAVIIFSNIKQERDESRQRATEMQTELVYNLGIQSFYGGE